MVVALGDRIAFGFELGSRYCEARLVSIGIEKLIGALGQARVFRKPLEHAGARLCERHARRPSRSNRLGLS